MIPWASHTHYLLWLQGHHGRKRQAIIDYAARYRFDPIVVGQFSASLNKRRLDNLKIEIPSSPWYVEIADTVVYWTRLARSIVKFGW